MPICTEEVTFQLKLADKEATTRVLMASQDERNVYSLTTHSRQPSVPPNQQQQRAVVVSGAAITFQLIIQL